MSQMDQWFGNAFSSKRRTFVWWKCKGLGPCKRNFGAFEQSFLCHKHNYGGGEFYDDCARRNGYNCYIWANYLRWKN